MAAPSFASPKTKVIANKRHVQVLWTPSTSYLTATPSENVATVLLGLKVVESIYIPTVDLLDPAVALTAASTKRGFSVTLVPHVAAETIVNLRYWETSGTEVADAVDKSASTFFIVFVGT